MSVELTPNSKTYLVAFGGRRDVPSDIPPLPSTCGQYSQVLKQTTQLIARKLTSGEEIVFAPRDYDCFIIEGSDLISNKTELQNRLLQNLPEFNENSDDSAYKRQQIIDAGSNPHIKGLSWAVDERRRKKKQTYMIYASDDRNPSPTKGLARSNTIRSCLLSPFPDYRGDLEQNNPEAGHSLEEGVSISSRSSESDLVASTTGIPESVAGTVRKILPSFLKDKTTRGIAISYRTSLEDRTITRIWAKTPTHFK